MIELVTRRERDARKHLERLDPEHRERHAGDDPDVPHQAPCPLAYPLFDRVALGAVHLPLEPSDNRLHVAAPQALDRSPEALLRLVASPSPSTSAATAAPSAAATTPSSPPPPPPPPRPIPDPGICSSPPRSARTASIEARHDRRHVDVP